MDNKQFLQFIADYTPAILTGLAFATFAAVGIFFVEYYTNAFVPRFQGGAFYLAVFITVIQELTRFGLLISSIKDFSGGKTTNAYLGLIGSIMLVYHDVKTAGALTPLYPALDISGLLTFLILLGLLLEIRLILTIKNSARARVTVNGETKQYKFQFPENEKNIMHNGQRVKN